MAESSKTVRKHCHILIPVTYYQMIETLRWERCTANCRCQNCSRSYRCHWSSNTIRCYWNLCENNEKGKYTLRHMFEITQVPTRKINRKLRYQHFSRLTVVRTSGAGICSTGGIVVVSLAIVPRGR